MEHVDQLAQFVTSCYGAFGFSFLIVICALWVYWFRFKKQITPLISAITEANQKLRSYEGTNGFAENFEEINAWIESIDILKDAWREFRENLIFPSIDDPNAPIKNSKEAYLFFDEQSLIDKYMNINLFSSVPNYLTGAGILGTFIGLVFGIYLAHKGLISSDPNELNEALMRLLGGASLAFITSIAGIGSSIVFSWKKKKCVHRLHTLISDWNAMIDERVELATVEQYASKSLIESQKHTLQLEKFNTDLAFSIASALEDKMAERLGPTLNKLIDTVQALKDDRGELNHQILNNMIDQFKQSISGAAHSEMSAICESLASLQQNLNGTVNALALGNEKVQETNRQMAEELKSALTQSSKLMNEEVIKAVESMTKQFESCTESTTNKLIQASDYTSKSVIASAEKFQESTELLASLTDKIENLLLSSGINIEELNKLSSTFGQAYEELQKLIYPVREVANKVTEAGVKIVETMKHNDTLVDQLNNLSNRMEDSSEKMAKSWEEYRKRFEEIDQSLVNFFEQINLGLEAYTNRVKEFATQLDMHTASAIGKLGGATGELREAIEELIDGMNKH